jgi:hypothetical protein
MECIQVERNIFERGRASITNSKCCECPTTATNDNKQEQAGVMILIYIDKCKVL